MIRRRVGWWTARGSRSVMAGTLGGAADIYKSSCTSGARLRLRIATWNVNSLRTRIDRVEALLDRHEIDVLAVQETKAREEQLPLMGLQARGYEIAAAGTNQWNGVATSAGSGSRTSRSGSPASPGSRRSGDLAETESRAIGATCGGVRLWSLYVPNGRKPDDPHYVYKLEWYAALREAARDWLGRDSAGRRLGRLPDRRRRLRRHPVQELDHVTPAERAAFFAFVEEGWVDTAKPYDAGYTYWDYYRQRFERDRACASTSCSARRRWRPG